MLFLSLIWKSTNGKLSIVGAIPSSLFNLCCIQECLSSIQHLICTKLTSPSNAMGSDPKYICNCYDIMANLAAFCNDTILVINRRLTISEDKHGNLCVRGSVDSYILGSVYSKHTVKNICT